MLQNFGLTYSYVQSGATSSGHSLGKAFILIFIAAAVLAIANVVGFWRVFQKAGRPGWAAIVPLYSSWVLFEISGKPGWWALISLLGVLHFIPFVGVVGILVYFVLYIVAMLELAKRFGKSTTFAIFGLIIFSVVGFLILGFGKAKYETVAADGWAPNAPTTSPPNPPQSISPQTFPQPPTPPVSQNQPPQPPQQPPTQPPAGLVQ